MALSFSDALPDSGQPSSEKLDEFLSQWPRGLAQLNQEGRGFLSLKNVCICMQMLKQLSAVRDR